MDSLSAAQKKVLITGATGGLGLALVRIFAQKGFKVRATGRRESARNEITSSGAEFFKADITKLSDLETLCDNQDIIIHAAALSDSWGHPQDFYDANVTATQNLLEISEKKGVKGFIYISTPSIYAAMVDQHNITEEDEPLCPPLNDYAKTKLAAEKHVLAANKDSFKTVALRPRAIVGPDDRILLPKIMEMINRGFLPSFRNGKAVIELTDVRDVANAVLLASQKINDASDKISGEAFNISGGKAIPIKQLAFQLAQSTGQKINFIPLPMAFAKYLAKRLERKGVRGGYKVEPKLTRYSLATLAYAQTFDMSKAKKYLGYEPSYDAVQTILDVAKARGA